MFLISGGRGGGRNGELVELSPINERNEFRDFGRGEFGVLKLPGYDQNSISQENAFSFKSKLKPLNMPKLMMLLLVLILRLKEPGKIMLHLNEKECYE